MQCPESALSLATTDLSDPTCYIDQLQGRGFKRIHGGSEEAGMKTQAEGVWTGFSLLRIWSHGVPLSNPEKDIKFLDQFLVSMKLG
jgi:hypothetical protein